MIGEIVTVKLVVGFMGNGDDWIRIGLALLAMAIYLSLSGSRCLALEQLFFGKKKA